jgi:hypothetical protein
MSKAGKNEAKLGWRGLFGAGRKPTEAGKRLHRVEELRRDLFSAKAGSEKQAEYALNMLLSMLWGETDMGRLAVACALSDAPPLLGKAEAPVFAERLCARLNTTPADPLALPATPNGDHLRQWAGQTLAALLNDALNAVKLFLRQTPRPDDETTYRETDICRDALRLATRLHSPEMVEAGMRLLRLFTPDLARETGPLGRQTPELRALASQLLASLSPDDLYPFWVALSGPESASRRDLLPALDYFNDSRAVPYLLKLLERRVQWSDGDLVGWATVRALQRIGDRRALPALRRLVSAHDRATLTLAPDCRTPVISLQLMQAARNAIETIEHGRASPERNFLLRPSLPDAKNLLHPASDANREQTDLLRPDTEVNHGEHGGHGERQEKKRTADDTDKADERR